MADVTLVEGRVARQRRRVRRPIAKETWAFDARITLMPDCMRAGKTTYAR
jgi:hypothetical protein